MIQRVRFIFPCLLIIATFLFAGSAIGAVVKVGALNDMTGATSDVG